MPHDLNGNPLKAGDEVIVRFTVRAIMEDTGFCNADIESVYSMPGNGFRLQLSNINTRQMELVALVAEVAPVEASAAEVAPVEAPEVAPVAEVPVEAPAAEAPAAEAPAAEVPVEVVEDAPLA